MGDALVASLFEVLVKGVMVEDVCGCIKERLLGNSECQHCGEVHGEGREEGWSSSVGIDVEVECVDCGKKMAASRFASHLEKCLSQSTVTASITESKTNSNSNNNKKRKQK